MSTLIWKEWREHLKWAPLPGVAILLVFLIARPVTPMPGVTGAYFLCLIAVVFGAALGFLQVVFEAQGDKRSLLLHRPLSPSRIFLAKAIAGIALYLVASSFNVHSASGLRMICSCAINILAVLIFAWRGALVYTSGVPMLLAGIAGGYGGALAVKRLNASHARIAILVYAWGLTAWFFLRKFVVS